MTDATPAFTRRALLGAAGGTLLLPAWARGADPHHPAIHPGFDEARGPALALTIAAGSYSVAGRTGHAVAVNGSIPGPLVRLREGEKARIVVHNLLPEDSSIHWHGLLLPFQYDGVPGVSFPGIGPALIGGTAIRAFRSRAAITARSSSTPMGKLAMKWPDTAEEVTARGRMGWKGTVIRSPPRQTIAGRSMGIGATLEA